MNQQPLFGQMSVEALAERLAALDEAIANADAAPNTAPEKTLAVQLIDVREPAELELAKLEGFLNLPLSQFAEWSADIRTRLNPDEETIVMCHHGMRSAQMCQWLVNQGFTNVKNLSGGIDAYSVVVDPSVPRY